MRLTFAFNFLNFCQLRYRHGTLALFTSQQSEQKFTPVPCVVCAMWLQYLWWQRKVFSINWIHQHRYQCIVIAIVGDCSSASSCRHYSLCHLSFADSNSAVREIIHLFLRLEYAFIYFFQTIRCAVCCCVHATCKVNRKTNNRTNSARRHVENGM